MIPKSRNQRGPTFASVASGAPGSGGPYIHRLGNSRASLFWKIRPICSQFLSRS